MMIIMQLMCRNSAAEDRELQTQCVSVDTAITLDSPPGDGDENRTESVDSRRHFVGIGTGDQCRRIGINCIVRCERLTSPNQVGCRLHQFFDRLTCLCSSLPCSSWKANVNSAVRPRIANVDVTSRKPPERTF